MTPYTVRYARYEDCGEILRMLRVMARLHADWRPDMFKATSKHDLEGLHKLLADENYSLLIAEDKNHNTVGYAICRPREEKGHRLMQDSRWLHIEDLYADESVRGQGMGKMLFDECLAIARELGLNRVELNVWACNDEAIAFYDRQGLTVQKMTMEMGL